MLKHFVFVFSQKKKPRNVFSVFILLFRWKQVSSLFGQIMFSFFLFAIFLFLEKERFFATFLSNLYFSLLTNHFSSFPFFSSGLSSLWNFFRTSVVHLLFLVPFLSLFSSLFSFLNTGLVLFHISFLLGTSVFDFFFFLNFFGRFFASPIFCFSASWTKKTLRFWNVSSFLRFL